MATAAFVLKHQVVHIHITKYLLYGPVSYPPPPSKKNKTKKNIE